MGKIPEKKNRGIAARLVALDDILGSGIRLTKDELLQRLNAKLESLNLETISERSLAEDISHLRKVHGAPIDRPTPSAPGYFYSEPFSIQKKSLDDEEMDILRKGIEMIRGAFSNVINQSLEEILFKLEGRIEDVKEAKTWISFEQQPYVYSSYHLNDISDAIRGKTALEIDYKPFNKEKSTFVFHPYFIKEYRNRWFCIGLNSANNNIENLAFDRIIKFKTSNQKFIEHPDFNPDTYFKYVVGVSVPYGEKPQDIELQISPQLKNYIETKPIHPDQEIVQAGENFVVKLRLITNKELIQLILGYGSQAKVLNPPSLIDKIKQEILLLNSLYQLNSNP